MEKNIFIDYRSIILKFLNLFFPDLIAINEIYRKIESSIFNDENIKSYFNQFDGDWLFVFKVLMTVSYNFSSKYLKNFDEDYFTEKCSLFIEFLKYQDLESRVKVLNFQYDLANMSEIENSKEIYNKFIKTFPDLIKVKKEKDNENTKTDDLDDVSSDEEEIENNSPKLSSYKNEEIQQFTKEQLSKFTDYKGGFIYIGTDQNYEKDDIYKIGRTDNSIKQRFSQFQTGRVNGDRFYCKHAFNCYNSAELESFIHQKLAKYNHSKEFFKIKYEKLVEVIQKCVDCFNALHELNKE